MKRHNAESIGEVLRQYLRVSNLENIVFQERIATIWQETVGEVITKETESLSMQNGCLYIRLKSPSLKTEIMMRRTVIATLLNQKLGADVIKNVFVR